MFEEAYITTEKQMLDYSDLHFSLVAIEDPLTGNLDRSITGKNQISLNFPVHYHLFYCDDYLLQGISGAHLLSRKGTNV